MNTCKGLFCAIFFIFACVADCPAKAVEDEAWELASEISHITYDEPDVMEEKGAMYGILGSYTYHKDIMFRIEARFSYGQVDYKNSGTINNIDDYMMEFRGLIGQDISAYERYIVTPYIGFGYRYLNDDTSGMVSSTGARGYERESNYFYSPVGIEILVPVEEGWSLGAIIEYDHFWKGIQKSHLSDASASFNDLENDQNKGFGLRGSLRFKRQGRDMDLLIEPFIRYWHIEESETANITYNGVIWGFGWEPKNTSTEAGIKFALVF